MKRILIFAAVMVMACGYAHAESDVWVNGLKYVVYDDGTAAWKAKIYNDTHVEPPSQDTIKIADFVNYNGREHPVTSIVRGDSITRDDLNLTYHHNFILGSNIHTISDGAFSGFYFLSFDLKNVEHIGKYAFSSCQFQRPLDLKNVKTIDSYAFRSTRFQLYKDEYASDSYAQLPPIDLKNVKEIGDYAFYLCIFSIGTNTITLPETITSLGKAVFYDTWVNKVIVNTSFLSDSLFASTKLRKRPIDAVLSRSIKNIPESCFSYRKLETNPITTDMELETISSKAFFQCEFVDDSIVFPNTLRTIGDSAFTASTVRCVAFPASLETIGANAFTGSSLTTIDWGDSNPNVEQSAFNDTPWYNNAPNGMLYAGNVAIKYKGAFPEDGVVEVKEGITLLADKCFYGRTGLVKVLLPKSLERIGKSAFEYSSIQYLELPPNNNLKRIDKRALRAADKLTSLLNFDNVEYIDIDNYENVYGQGTPWFNNQDDGLIYIGKVAFKYKGEMPENTSITLKPNTTMIADQCFNGESNLVAIDCGDSLRYILGGAFYNCKNLKKVSLDNRFLEEFDLFAFYGCSLNELHISDLPSWLYSYDVPPTTLDKAGIYDEPYPAIYYNANYKGGAVKAANVYVGGTKLEHLDVPEGVTTINTNMIEGCALKSVHIPSTCSRITGYSGVFFNSPLETITIADGNTAYRVQDNALYRKVDFYRDTLIVETEWGGTSTPPSHYETLLKFTDWILEKGSKNTKTIPPVAKVVDYAFSRTRNPNLLTFEEGTKKIGKYAFSHCNFKKVVLPHSLIELGDYAFNWCNNLEEVVIGPQKPAFGHQPFVNCAKLSTIRLYIKDPSVFTGNASSSVFPAGCVIYVPRGSGESYRSTPYFTGYEIREFDDAPKGDIDGNGVVDGIDLNTMINFILDKSSPSATQIEIADFDGSGFIDGTDLNQMINTILGQ